MHASPEPREVLLHGEHGVVYPCAIQGLELHHAADPKVDEYDARLDDRGGPATQRLTPERGLERRSFNHSRRRVPLEHFNPCRTECRSSLCVTGSEGG